jgi:hypothetical protein
MWPNDSDRRHDCFRWLAQKHHPADRRSAPPLMLEEKEPIRRRVHQQYRARDSHQRRKPGRGASSSHDVADLSDRFAFTIHRPGRRAFAGHLTACSPGPGRTRFES